jgi:hypothetical protein
MWTSVQQLQDKVQDLESKMSLVVSKDNKVIPSLEAELAREKLRQDVNSTQPKTENVLLF